jgi:RING/U-box domain-containing protein
MGLSSMPSPKDSLFTFLLYNTAVSIAILSNLLRAVMAFVGIPVPPAWDDEDHLFAAAAASSSPPARGPTLVDRFRSSFTPALFGRRRATGSPDCRVCLARFEPESVVNRLPCGHLFHRACLETWLDYDHATCPLCRHRLLPAASSPPSPEPAITHFAWVY